MTPRRARLAATSVLALLAVGVLALTLLRPAGNTPTPARAQDEVALIDQATRKQLPRLMGSTLIPPPATIELAGLHGKPAFLSVWASWCPSCREEAPTMASVARKHGRTVQFVGIDIQDRREDGRAFVRRFGLRYPHIFDAKATIATKLGVSGIPTAFLIDRQG
ncbi:MAG: TlpA family protein disulfide reductase, partial [Actinomycetota bacterium]